MNSDTHIKGNECAYINHTLTQQQVVSVTRILEHESTKADVLEIFQPLKVRHGHTAGVDVDVW